MAQVESNFCSLLDRAQKPSIVVDLIADETIGRTVDGKFGLRRTFINPSCFDLDKPELNIRVRSGDVVQVNVLNELDESVNFAIPGLLEHTQHTRPHSSSTYYFIAPEEGEYRYHDELHNPESDSKDLVGLIQVLPRTRTPSFPVSLAS